MSPPSRTTSRPPDSTAAPQATPPLRLVGGDEESDESLLGRLRAGDGDAGSALVARYDGMLLGYLRRLVGSDHLAEELHQAAWVSVLENLDKFDPASQPGGFKAWLFRIATNKAHDLFRRGGREQAATLGWRLVRDQTQGPGDAATPDGRLERQERARRLHEAVQKLPEAQREVVLMRYYGNLKFSEIADALGCPLNTALGRMHKAVQKLRQMLGDLDGV